MTSQANIARHAEAAGITTLQAYYNIKAIEALQRRGELAKAGYRHLLK